MLAAEREARHQQILGDLLRRELADQLTLLIAKALLLEARSDAGVQQHRVDRLGQVVLGAHLDAPDHAVELVERRRDDHRDVAEVRIELQLRQHLVAVELGHQDIEQHQVEVLATQQVERLAAVLCEHDGVPLLFQPAAEQKAVHPVVVDDQDRPGREAPRRSRRGCRPERGESLLEGSVLSLDSIDELGGAVQLVAPRSELELSAELGEAAGAERLAVRLQGMRRPAQPFRVALLVCRPQRCDESRARRSGTRRSLPPGTPPRRALSGSRSRSPRGWRERPPRSPCACPRADGRDSTPPPARSDGSAWQCSHPSRRRSRPRGPRAWRSPSWR